MYIVASDSRQMMAEHAFFCKQALFCKQTSKQSRGLLSSVEQHCADVIEWHGGVL